MSTEVLKQAAEKAARRQYLAEPEQITAMGDFTARVDRLSGTRWVDGELVPFDPTERAHDEPKAADDEPHDSLDPSAYDRDKRCSYCGSPYACTRASCEHWPDEPEAADNDRGDE